ncbi:hypothetical protein A4V08_35520 [Lachnoclostridium sp. YL32]|nr:hypothetical protein A4V08_35520 [Lachnoclostridium sp. YL32]
MTGHRTAILFYYRKVLAETKLCKLIVLPKEGIENRRWFRTGRYRTLLPIHHRRGRHLQLKSNAYPINQNRSCP